MAVEERPTSNNAYEDSDDEKPLVFKRGTPSKQTESKYSASSSQNSNGLKANPDVLRQRASLPKEPSATVHPSSSSLKQSPVKISACKEASVHTPKPEIESDKEEDTDDDKPLSFRMKGASNVSNNTNQKLKRAYDSDDDDDDNVPISSKVAGTSNNTLSGTNNSSASSEKNSLTPKVAQNGSIGNPKTGLVPSKRSIVEENRAGQASAKKPKSSLPKEAGKVEIKTDEDHIPMSQRIKKASSSSSKPSTSKKTVTKVSSSSFKKGSNGKKQMGKSQYSKSTKVQPNSSDGQKKWTTLVHNGVIFPPPYTPHGIKILYKGKPVDLTPEQEEVATMFAVMKDTDYVQKPKFIENFWTDWRKILGKNHIVQKLEDCDFTPIYDWHMQEKEKKKNMTSDEKKAIKEEKLKKEDKYMWAIVDGVKEKVGNFRVEPPALFRGRGEHPKMGKLKRRILPSEITLNIGKESPIPECPIPGESWKEVKHDNTVTWLAFWNDPINTREMKYVFLAASSSLKGQSDKEKYEKARKLKDYIHNIRAAYTKDFSSKDMMKRQIAVATYLIDKLALRAGNEKDDDEADTVGCCTLKVSNVECVPPNKLKFDFLGKDSIRYENTVEVEPLVYKAVGQFRSGKKQEDDLFDLLDTLKLNATLRELMPGLTAKVFRTYNASITLDEQLHAETGDGDVNEKMMVYNQANKQVAIICNHQRTISKNHGEQMSKLTDKIGELKALLKELKTDLDRAKKGKPPLKDADGKTKKNLSPEAIEKKIATTNQKIEKMEFAMQTKEDLKAIALGTSKVNYLDPRITVAWCKRHEVPIEKIFNKSLIAKFAWSMDVDPDFRF